MRAVVDRDIRPAELLVDRLPADWAVTRRPVRLESLSQSQAHPSRSMDQHNSLREAIGSDGVVYGARASTFSPTVVEVYGHLGFEQVR